MSKEIDCWLTEYITCPYCGNTFPDSWEFNEFDSGDEVECDECGKEFILEEVQVTTRYSTKKKDA